MDELVYEFSYGWLRQDTIRLNGLYQTLFMYLNTWTIGQLKGLRCTENSIATNPQATAVATAMHQLVGVVGAYGGSVRNN